MGVNESGELVFTPGANVEGMVSKLGLIDGDSETKVTPNFTSQYAQLAEFHMLKERQGRDIIQKNLEVVEKIGKIAWKFMNGGELLKDDSNG